MYKIILLITNIFATSLPSMNAPEFYDENPAGRGARGRGAMNRLAPPQAENYMTYPQEASQWAYDNQSPPYYGSPLPQRNQAAARFHQPNYFGYEASYGENFPMSPDNFYPTPFAQRGDPRSPPHFRGRGARGAVPPFRGRGRGTPSHVRAKSNEGISQHEIQKPQDFHGNDDTALYNPESQEPSSIPLSLTGYAPLTPPSQRANRSTYMQAMHNETNNFAEGDKTFSPPAFQGRGAQRGLSPRARRMHGHGGFLQEQNFNQPQEFYYYHEQSAFNPQLQEPIQDFNNFRHHPQVEPEIINQTNDFYAPSYQEERSYPDDAIYLDNTTKLPQVSNNFAGQEIPTRVQGDKKFSPPAFQGRGAHRGLSPRARRMRGHGGFPQEQSFNQPQEVYYYHEQGAFNPQPQEPIQNFDNFRHYPQASIEPEIVNQTNDFYTPSYQEEQSYPDEAFYAGNTTKPPQVASDFAGQEIPTRVQETKPYEVHVQKDYELTPEQEKLMNHLVLDSETQMAYVRANEYLSEKGGKAWCRAAVCRFSKLKFFQLPEHEISQALQEYAEAIAFSKDRVALKTLIIETMIVESNKFCEFVYSLQDNKLLRNLTIHIPNLGDVETLHLAAALRRSKAENLDFLGKISETTAYFLLEALTSNNSTFKKIMIYGLKTKFNPDKFKFLCDSCTSQNLEECEIDHNSKDPEKFVWRKDTSKARRRSSGKRNTNNIL
jgi:hypothetical protein